METEKLYCEPGNHKWSRERTRGRKPTACPKHKPVAVAQSNSTSNGVRVLHCQNGNHDWERPIQRGKPPVNCPDHAPIKVVLTHATTQKLHCHIGDHEWERPSQRGIKPHNCPEHKLNPVPSNSVVTTQPNGFRVLHCEAGNHDWERAPQRGRVPVNCPQHSATPPRTVPVRIVSDAFPIQDIPEEELPLVEVEGDYESETTEEEQRTLLTAAFNPPTVKRGPGRPRIHQTPEEQAEAELARSRAKVDQLEANLKLNGTHISQQAPYSLYKLVKGIANTPDADYDYVRDFSPLAKEQFVNQFPERFEAGIYFFKRDGEKVEL